MTIRELIAHLEGVYQQYGNIEISAFDDKPFRIVQLLDERNVVIGNRYLSPIAHVRENPVSSKRDEQPSVGTRTTRKKDAF